MPFVLKHATRKELQYIKLIDINMQVLTFFVKECVPRWYVAQRPFVNDDIRNAYGNYRPARATGKSLDLYRHAMAYSHGSRDPS